MRYTKEQIERLKETSMADILRDLGYDTRHTASGLFFSPFRSEKSPSFHINDRDHKWADLGSADPSRMKAGKKAVGGDVIDLVCALRNCSFGDALDFLASFNPSVAPAKDEVIGAPGAYRSPGKVKVEKVQESFLSRLLLDYATKERLIPRPLLDRYCSQVNYRIVREDGTSSREYFAIGFPNRAGNWTLRNSIVKISSGSDITLISSDGSFMHRDAKAHSPRVAVFEGFMDFLSWLAWRGREIPGDCDVVVLNSTSNTSSALDFILEHKVAVGYFDNDAAGKAHSEWLAAECDINGDDTHKTAYYDRSSSFDGYNDINEAWVAACRQASEKKEEKGESTAEAATEKEEDEQEEEHTQSRGRGIH